MLINIDMYVIYLCIWLHVLRVYIYIYIHALEMSLCMFVYSGTDKLWCTYIHIPTHVCVRKLTNLYM